jgi:hypothetical protein
MGMRRAYEKGMERAMKIEFDSYTIDIELY